MEFACKFFFVCLSLPMKFFIKEQDPVQIQERLLENPAIKLLDIREPMEHDYVHLENSILVNSDMAREIIEKWSRDTEMICYCHHGSRSHQAAWALAQRGFTNVTNMLGGIEAWAKLVEQTLPRY